MQTGCENTIASVSAPTRITGEGDVFLSMTVACDDFLGCDDDVLTISARGKEFRTVVDTPTGREPIDEAHFAGGDRVQVLVDPAPQAGGPAFPFGETTTVQFRVGDCVVNRDVEVNPEEEPTPTETPDEEPEEPAPTLDSHDIVAVRAPSTAEAGEFVELEMDVTCPSAFGCRTQRATISSGERTFLDRDVSFSEDVATLTTFAQFFEPGETVTVQFAVGSAARFRDIVIQAAPTEPEPEPAPEEPADLPGHDLVSVDAPDAVQAGETATLSLTAECTSPTGCRTQTASISAGETVLLERDDVSFAAGEPVTLSADVTFEEPGPVTVQFAVGGAARTREVLVLEAPPGGPADEEFPVEALLAGGAALLLLLVAR